MSDSPLHLAFESGTVVVTGGTSELLASLPYCKYDPRAEVYRAEARSFGVFTAYFSILPRFRL